MLILYTLFPLILAFISHYFLHKKTLPLPPGPWGYPILGSIPLIGPQAHSSLAKLAQRYGPIMYLKMGTQGVVVASTSSSASTFLKTFDSQFANRPPIIAGHEITYGSQNIVLHKHDHKWKLLRKLSTMHLLGARALTRWEHVRRTEIDRLVRALRGFAVEKKPVKLAEMLMCTMANIMGIGSMSMRVFEDVGGEEKNEFKEMIADIMVASGFNIGDFVPALAWMDLQGMKRKMESIHKRYDAMISRMIGKHQAKLEERNGNPDFLDSILSCRDVGEGEEKLSDENIKGLIFDMFTAGTDTAAIIIEWAMAELINNPSILKRAQEEMDRVIGTSCRIQESDIQNLPYLQAICKEALRLHPSTPLSIPHFSVEECDNVEGYYIPRNTRLLVNIWAIGRDPHVWKNPLEFDPDRFLDGEELKQQSDFDYIPFGAGRRICVGKQAGLIFVQLILGTLVHAFDWKLLDGKDRLNMDEMPGLVIPMADPVVALVDPRLESNAYVI